MDAFFEGGWGKLSLGQGDGAANGGVEVDLSGTTVAHYAGVSDIGGGFAFRGPGGALSTATIASTIDRQDFESRYDRVRYDTPVFGGFRAAGSLGSKDNGRDVAELALWYSGDLVGREGKVNYVKAGYKFGRHAVSADFASSDDQAAAGDEGKMVGVAYVFTPVATSAGSSRARKKPASARPSTGSSRNGANGGNGSVAKGAERVLLPHRLGAAGKSSAVWWTRLKRLVNTVCAMANSASVTCASL